MNLLRGYTAQAFVVFDMGMGRDKLPKFYVAASVLIELINRTCKALKRAVCERKPHFEEVYLVRPSCTACLSSSPGSRGPWRCFSGPFPLSWEPFLREFKAEVRGPGTRAKVRKGVNLYILAMLTLLPSNSRPPLIMPFPGRKEKPKGHFYIVAMLGAGIRFTDFQ